MELNHNVAHGYEVDLGLQVKALGLRIVFDPQIAIRHYSAPRKIHRRALVQRFGGVRWASYNHARVAMRRLPMARKRARCRLLDCYRQPQRARAGPHRLGPIARRMGFRVAMGGAAFRGRLAAVKGCLAYPRS